MATKIDHLKTAGVVAAVLMGATAMLRSVGSAPPEPPAIATHPPPPCKQACDALRAACSAESVRRQWPNPGDTVNCAPFLTSRESADGGWTCSQSVTPDTLAALGLAWCADGGGP